MSADKPKCPKLGSAHTVKNEKIHNGIRKFKCQSCGRQFIENPTNLVIDAQTKELILQLLLERISLAGIARVTGVYKKWLQDYVNARRCFS